MSRCLAPLFAALFFLVSCSGTDTDRVAAAERDAAQIIGSSTVNAICPAGPCGIAGAYAQLKVLYPGVVSKAADDQVATILATAPSMLAALAQVSDNATRAANLKGILADATQIANILTPVLAPLAETDPAIRSILGGIQAATILAPFIQVAIDQLAPPAAATPGAAGKRAVPAPERLEAARAALRQPRPRP